jgi:hypothetical protein
MAISTKECATSGLATGIIYNDEIFADDVARARTQAPPGISCHQGRENDFSKSRRQTEGNFARISSTLLKSDQNPCGRSAKSAKEIDPDLHIAESGEFIDPGRLHLQRPFMGEIAAFHLHFQIMRPLRNSSQC